MNALELIAAERARQQAEERYTTDHDDEHVGGELALAAACYAAGTCVYEETGAPLAPWDDPDIIARGIQRKPRLRQLVIAGALIVAEIERLQRAALTSPTAPTGEEP